MQHSTNRLRWAGIPVALRVVGMLTLCVAALSFLALHPAPHAKATGQSTNITGTISSSPYSGPTGTTISVSGSNWGGTDGTPVLFGYQVSSGCQTVSDAQNGTLSGGSFSGWFRWPSGTALNTFRVCAMLGNVMEVAGSFSVLSSNPPAVSISPSRLAPNTQATITASNYYPAATSVNFLWMSGNTVIENLNSAASNTSGVAMLTFTVPKFSIANGPYSINASAGGGQPATLFSSTNFTYSAPVVSPSPTVRPSPTPSPALTPSVTPTTTPTVAPSATASVTAINASPTAGTSPTVGNSQTPTTNGTSSGNNGGTNTGTPTASSPGNALLIGGVAVLAGALLAGIAVLLLLRRRRKEARAKTKGMPPRLPGNPNFVPYLMYNPAAAPGMSAPQFGNMPVRPPAPAPVPVGVGAFVGNGHPAAPAAYPGPGTMAPMPLSPMAPPWLSNPSSNGNAPTGAGSAPPTMSMPADPALDAMRRQAQSGLFVSPRPFRDERSQ